jgi:hypothetical protein
LPECRHAVINKPETTFYTRNGHKNRQANATQYFAFKHLSVEFGKFFVNFVVIYYTQISTKIMFCFKFQSGTYFIPAIICLLFNSCVSLEKYEAQQNNLERTKRSLRAVSEENDILNSDKAELMRKNITINEQLIQKEQLLTNKLDSLQKQYRSIKAKNDILEQLSSGAKNDALVFQQMLGDMAKKFDDFQVKNTDQTKAIQRDIRKIQTETRKISDKLESANTSPQ